MKLQPTTDTTSLSSILTNLRHTRRPPILDLEDRISVLGVELPKGTGGPRCPSLARFKNEVLTPWDLKFMKTIAIGLHLPQAILIEGGSGIGKSTAIERLAAFAQREVFYANCAEYDVDTLIGSKTIEKDGSVVWRDGLVLQCFRRGGWLFLDEFNFMRGEVRGRLNEFLDVVLNGKGVLSLPENYGELVHVHRDTRIIAAQNSPGGDQTDRQVLDRPQFTRFYNIRQTDTLPPEVQRARALGAAGQAPPVELSASDFLHTPKERTPLKDVPGSAELMEKFSDFSIAYEKLLEERQIGRTEKQPVFCSFQRDLRRVQSFVEAFYDRNPTQVFQQALRCFYRDRLGSDDDRALVEQMIQVVKTDAVPKPLPKPMELGEAAAILKENLLGPDAWQAAFSARVGCAPPIPTAISDELLSSRCPVMNNGQQVKDSHLLLLLPKALDGKPLTLRQLATLCERGLKEPRSFRPRASALLLPSLERLGLADQRVPESRWVLIPRNQRGESQLLSERRIRDWDKPRSETERAFFGKTAAEQSEAHELLFPHYEQAAILELLCAWLLRPEPKVGGVAPPTARCREASPRGGQLALSFHSTLGPVCCDYDRADSRVAWDRALVRKIS